MIRSLSASARSVSSSVSRPRSTKASELGASGGVAIGISVIQGWRSITSRWTIAQERRLSRQPFPSTTNSSAPSALAFHISCRSSSLPAT